VSPCKIEKKLNGGDSDLDGASVGGSAGRSSTRTSSLPFFLFYFYFGKTLEIIIQLNFKNQNR
jgi:hypothetical protein